MILQTHICRPSIHRLHYLISQTQLSARLVLARHSVLHRLPHCAPPFNLVQPPKRPHSGHSHHHSKHQHEELTGEGARITIIGIISNVGLSIVKAFGGWWYNSPSLLADAGHNISDLLSDFVTLYSVRYSRKKPDEAFPWGYGKIESLGTFTISGLLLSGAIGFGLHSTSVLLPYIFTVSEAHALLPHIGHSNGDGGHVIDGWALSIALGSLGVKEWLYRATIKVGKKLNSPVLIGNAWHHRSDGLASGVAVLGIGGSLLGFPILDPVGGVVVSAMIFKVGYDMGKSSLLELLDAGVDRETNVKIQKVLDEWKNANKDAIDFTKLKTRQSGPFLHVSLSATLPPSMSVLEATQLTKDVKTRLKQLDLDGELNVFVGVDCDQSAVTAAEKLGSETRSRCDPAHSDVEGHTH